MFVIESCQKIEYNALFMMIFIPVSNFGDQPLGIKNPKILYFHNKASIAHLVERLASDLMVPGSIPGGGGSFFNKSKDNKITSCFSVGLYFTSYNPTEK